MLDLFFSLLNFTVIAAAFYYGWLRIGKPALQEMAKKDLQELELLHDEHHKLVLEGRALEESIAFQGEECKTLSAKVHLWRDTVEKRYAQKEHERFLLYESYKQKIAQQDRKRQEALVYAKIKPQVILCVEKELREHFKHSEQMHIYMDRLLQELAHD